MLDSVGHCVVDNLDVNVSLTFCFDDFKCVGRQAQIGGREILQQDVDDRKQMRFKQFVEKILRDID